MRTEISNVIRVTNPSSELRQYVKDQLELPNPDYEKKQRMGFWTGRTPKLLRLYEWNGNTLILPFGLCRELLPLLRDGEIENRFTGGVNVDYGAPVPLYDYQREAVCQMVLKKYGILKSPAGSGKTQMGIALVKAIGKKALWLCHTADLLNQSKERAEMYMPKSMTGTITEGKVNIGPGITFATVQTMCNVDLDRYRNEWDTIIVDECHRISQSATTVTRYQKVLNNLSARHKIGLTATPERSDGLIRATYSLIGQVVYEVPEEAVQERVMQVTIRPVRTETEITDDCLNVDGTISYTGLIEHLTTDPDRIRLIAGCIAENRGHSCLILSDRIAHLEAIQDALPEDMRKESALITGKMTSKSGKAERQEAIEKMRTGELRYLFASYSLAKEGLDIPRLDRLFLASPVKFSSVVIQSVGRIARTYNEKQTPVCYDFVDAEIGFCMGAYRKRCSHYRKLHAVIETMRGGSAHCGRAGS